jgi:hypothetical protein
MKYITTAIVIALVFISNFVLAQNKFTLSGTISDAGTGETMIGAVVRVREIPASGTVCNEYGFYSLTIPKGSYTILVQIVGYRAIEYTLDLSSDNSHDFKLVANAKSLEEVVITSTKRNENISSSKIGVEKLEVKEIKKIPVLFGEQDILKTLQLLPGVKSIGEGNGGLYVRGGDNSQNLILLDEATVYNANHLLGFFSTFNSDAIKDVSLYKGTAPASYGGRLSSVLDVRMNEGNNQQYHVGGGIGLIASRLNVEGPIVKDKGSFLITGRRTYADMFLKLSSDNNINSNQLYFYDLNAKANYQVNKKNKIFLSGYLGRDVLKFNNRFGIDWGNVTGTTRLNHIWNNKLFSNTSLIYSDYDYRVAITRDAGDFSITSKIKNVNLKHEFEYFRNNKNTMRFGINSTYHTITPGQVEGSDINAVALQNRNAIENAVYFSNNWKPNARWNVDYGLRLTTFNMLGPGDFYKFDYQNNNELTDTIIYKKGDIVKTYINLEPRLNIAYVLSESNSLKLSYTRNTQNLHVISNSTSSTPTDIWIASSNNVKPEICDQFSLGYFKNFKDNTLQFSTEVYYKQMQNQMDLKNGAEIRANDRIEGELLFGDGRAYGIELLLKKKYGKFNGWVGYTLSRTERKIDKINDGSWYAARQDATHDVSVVGIYDINKKWAVSATWLYVTGNAVTFPSGKYEINGLTQYYYTERNGYRMPDYHRMDIGVTKYFKKSNKFESSLNFSVYNLYGRKNAYTIDFEDNPNDPTKTQAVMTYLFTYVPSITYNFKF